MFSCRRIGEFFLLQFDSAIGHVVRSEIGLEFIPHDELNIIVGIAACIPPVSGHSEELVCRIENIFVFIALGDQKFLLYGLEPAFGLHGILGL
jgi:hypothetical protein